MGANNLIEPIDARPVFTAFSATLPPASFFSFFFFSLESNSSLSGFSPFLSFVIVMRRGMIERIYLGKNLEESYRIRDEND